MRLIQFFHYLDITNYADDNTPHSTNTILNEVLHDLVKMPNTLSKWLTHNLLKVNPEKSHLLTNSAQETQVYIDGRVISNSKCEKLLGIHIDNKLTLECHVRSLSKKTSQEANCFCCNCIFFKIWSKKTSS